METCEFCKDLLGCNEVYDIPWCEEGIYHNYDDKFYLVPQLDGKSEGLRPYIEIEYCPKCSRKLKI